MEITQIQIEYVKGVLKTMEKLGKIKKVPSFSLHKRITEFFYELWEEAGKPQGFVIYDLLKDALALARISQ